MNSCCIFEWTLLLTLITYTSASIETETKYTIITQPGDIDSSAPISKPIVREENVRSTDISKDDTSSRPEPDANLEDSVSINVLQNGKKLLRQL